MYKPAPGEEQVLLIHECTETEVIDRVEIHRLKDEQGFKKGYAILAGESKK